MGRRKLPQRQSTSTICTHGATQGAPEAVQIADRFHVLRNLAEAVERVLQHHRKGLKQIHLVTIPAASPSLLLRHLRAFSPTAQTAGTGSLGGAL